MTLVSKIVCHWQRGEKNVAQGGSHVSASNFRNYLDFKQLLRCYNVFDLHIAKKQQQQNTNNKALKWWKA